MIDQTNRFIETLSPIKPITRKKAIKIQQLNSINNLTNFATRSAKDLKAYLTQTNLPPISNLTTGRRSYNSSKANASSE